MKDSVSWRWYEQADQLARKLGCLTGAQIMLLISDSFYQDQKEKFNREFNSNLDWGEMQKFKSTLKSLLLDIMNGTKCTDDLSNENKYPEPLSNIYSKVRIYRDSHESSFLSGR